LSKNDTYVSIKLTYRLNMDRISGIDPGLALLLERAPGEVIDYGFVMDCLKTYKYERGKLHDLLKSGALIRVKKGIYIFGPKIAKRPYAPEVVANMIYGPSYVSLEWACQYYRLIPERVTTITSVTIKRSKEFHTPLGLFTYDHQSLDVFSAGSTYVKFSETAQALIATKEKALVDLLVMRRGLFKSMKHFRETLFDDLRVEEEDIADLNQGQLKELYKARPHSAIKFLMECLNE